MPFFDFRKKKIFYSISGKGQPLVMLHGFCGDSLIWDAYENNWPGVMQIRVDLPGWGRSEVVQNCGLEDMAELINGLLDHLSINKVMLIGHSMGGYVGLAFAENYSERLVGLGLFHSHPYADSKGKKEQRIKQIAFVGKYGPALYVKNLIPALFSPAYVRDHRMQIDQMIHRASQYAPAAIQNSLQAMHDRPDRSEVLRKIQCPVLFIIGLQEQTIDPKLAIAQTEMTNISRIDILPKVNHMGMLEASRHTYKSISQFIQFCDQLSVV